MHERAGTLEARQAAFGYQNATIVERLDLALAPATFTALVGPNGSGKSTILRGLAGRISLRRGAVLLDGRSIASFSTRQVARLLAALPQGPLTPEGLTVSDLVQQGRYAHRRFLGAWSDEDESACRRALDLTGMHSLRERVLDTLSGGQRQRAWIAMTLAQQAGILLLDEPTTFLDLAHQIEVLDLLRELAVGEGTTVVAVLHDINQAARYADRMVVLRQGTIHAEGAPAEVVTPDVLREAFGVECIVIADPTSGSPLCVPVGRRSPPKVG